MLSQKFTAADAETQSFQEKKMEAKGKNKRSPFYFLFFISFSLRLCVSAVISFLIGCQIQPTDLRIFAPAETLVYLETSNVSKTLDALTENEVFTKLAASKKDFSALENVQLAVAVTGFETSRQQVTGEQSILKFKPRFVAVADTHAWNWQAISLTENQIGEFVNETYGGEVNLEMSDKNGGKWFVWTARDGRKAFAFVQDGKIFFGNDETAVENSLAAGRGEADSLLKNENFTRAYRASGENSAFGYISPDGVAQIANIAAVSTAIEASEDNAPRSFIARVLPQIVQKSVNEIVWTARKTERGIEDVFQISMNAEISSIFNETMIPVAGSQLNAAEFLPADIFSVTRYNLQNPALARRSLLLAARKQVDAASAEILTIFFDSVFEPYGIAGGEAFLSAVGAEILTARFDQEGEKSAVIATVKDADAVKKSLSEEINLKETPENQFGAEIWKSEDGTLSAAFIGDKLILGDSESVLKSLAAKQSGQNFAKTGHYQKFSESDAVAVTFSSDVASAEAAVKILGNLKNGQNALTNYSTETRFNEKGIERKTLSPFGFIGTILEQFGEEN